MASILAKRKYPFYLSIMILTVTLVLVLTGVFLSISRKESSLAALQTANRLFREVNQKVVERYEYITSAVTGFTGTAALMPGMTQKLTEDGLNHPSLNLISNVLKYYPQIFSTYIGFTDGTFLQVIYPNDNEHILSQYNSPPGTHLIVRAISQDDQGRRRQHWRFLDAENQILAKRDDAEVAYDPRIRPWYVNVIGTDQIRFTKPYIFYSSGFPGITCSRCLPGNKGVFGVDITLDQFETSLQQQKISTNSDLFLFDRKGQLIAHSRKFLAVRVREEADDPHARKLRFIKVNEVNDPVLPALFAKSHQLEMGVTPKEALMVEGREYLFQISEISPDLGFGMMIGSVAPLTDFTGYIQRMQQKTTLFSILLLALIFPLVFAAGKRFSRSLIRLGDEAVKVRRFDFSSSEPFDSTIKEIHVLIQAFDLMRQTIQKRTSALIATQQKLQTLVDSGMALSAQQDVDQLMEIIFTSAGALSRTDGGMLYLRDKQNRLNLEIMQTASQEIVGPNGINDPDLVKTIPLIDPLTGLENHHRLESHVALTGKTVIISNERQAKPFDLSMACLFNQKTDSTCHVILSVPLKPREEETIGVLQLVNARNSDSGDITPFGQEVIGFVEALAAQAAIALQNKRLLDDQRNLFNALIQLIAGAIDAKSPYTGGHCARVPEIAVMLARAASDATSGPFADFKFTNNDQWHEFKVAAWLHDCGKVTTPEFVVDKATKLETIYNRIHEVRTRFEVLWRDAEIAYYRTLLEGDADEKSLQMELEQTRSRLQKDFALVARCNHGSEAMPEEWLSDLHRIANQTWMRHFNDRLGLSHEELSRKAQDPPPHLPVQEFLLADKPEHIIPRNDIDPFNGNPYGFKVEIPTHLYHLGEVYSLSVIKGTLTKEERFKINEHIIQTLLMLKKLPFPKYLSQVPDVAASHHETMDGTGYPRGLTGNDMSIPARIMVIADIFEALTAKDRPYKSPKPLSESLAIMRDMRDDGHIDGQLFDLFLTAGVYRQYAEAFLSPEQIDTVDISKFLSRKA